MDILIKKLCYIDKEFEKYKDNVEELGYIFIIRNSIYSVYKSFSSFKVSSFTTFPASKRLLFLSISKTVRKIHVFTNEKQLSKVVHGDL
jgi:hypothetical protein